MKRLPKTEKLRLIERNFAIRFKSLKILDFWIPTLGLVLFGLEESQIHDQIEQKILICSFFLLILPFVYHITALSVPVSLPEKNESLLFGQF